MASTIKDSKGRVINVGDRVKTSTGEVFTVQGTAVTNGRVRHANEVTIVASGTRASLVAKASSSSGDAIVWGS